MKRVSEKVKERAIYVFAFILLAFAIYLNFFTRDKKPDVNSGFSTHTAKK